MKCHKYVRKYEAMTKEHVVFSDKIILCCRYRHPIPTVPTRPIEYVRQALFPYLVKFRNNSSCDWHVRLAEECPRRLLCCIMSYLDRNSNRRLSVPTVQSAQTHGLSRHFLTNKIHLSETTAHCLWQGSVFVSGRISIPYCPYPVRQAWQKESCQS